MAAGSASLCAPASDRAQPLDQAIEFVERAKVYDEFAHFLHPAMALDTRFLTRTSTAAVSRSDNSSSTRLRSRDFSFLGFGAGQR
jgi:hypothetical protein